MKLIIAYAAVAVLVGLAAGNVVSDNEEKAVNFWCPLDPGPSWSPPTDCQRSCGPNLQACCCKACGLNGNYAAPCQCCAKGGCGSDNLNAAACDNARRLI